MDSGKLSYTTVKDLFTNLFPSNKETVRAFLNDKKDIALYIEDLKFDIALSEGILNMDDYRKAVKELTLKQSTIHEKTI